MKQSNPRPYRGFTAQVHTVQDRYECRVHGRHPLHAFAFHRPTLEEVEEEFRRRVDSIVEIIDRCGRGPARGNGEVE